jgi:RING-box protein 1
MADVDMTDAPSGSTAPVKKTVGKAKAGASAEGGDGKKRFEVKKVRCTTKDLCSAACVLMMG